ncbi:NACHT domain-containing protein [Scytonema sp. UIC 10036]|uniref:NB-ARC domain-containing protein n=1 Tax=Scytonema sp. UIC 10036 TaxID=2304196 RepID=UPI0012DA4F77|nr:NB-ARC domain-containing protein [Scytonema sp. UIC 10036]MUG93231.1 NACHT domain-containing protein [Scytonema sp. UIC 10036]
MGFRASQEGLEIVDKARKQKGWTKTQTPIWWQTAYASRATLRRFWERKRPIKPEYFIAICNAVGVNWEEIVDKNSLLYHQTHQMSRQDLGDAPEAYDFYGRKEELSLLEQWIVKENCRLVALCGIGGIGKTYLAAELVNNIRNQVDYLFWRSLRSSPPLEDILATMLRFLSPEWEADAAQGLSQNISQLMGCLRNHRCLIVLDDFDAVLQNGDRTVSYLPGYEGYGELLKRWTETSTKSCLLLLSREKPREIAFKERKNSPVRSYKLTGLQLSEAEEILKDKELLRDGNAWEDLIRIYRGHPLALQIVSTIIHESFNGSVTTFLEEKTIILGDISILLSQQFKRLSSLEKEIMYWLALQQQPISILQLQLYVKSQITSSVLLEVLTSLGWRSLIEKTAEDNEVMFTLQPMVMKFTISEFVNQICSEISQGQIKLLKSHALVTEYHLSEQKTEFPYRPILPMIKNKLLGLLTDKNTAIERLRTLQSTIRENQDKGYSENNILNLLAQFNESSQ